MDQMQVMTEASDTAMGPEDRANAGRELAAAIKQSIGISVKIDVKDVGGVARSEGKAVRIVDNRPKT
jgi:phenylacetate-CoA ligase